MFYTIHDLDTDKNSSTFEQSKKILPKIQLMCNV